MTTAHLHSLNSQDVNSRDVDSLSHEVSALLCAIPSASTLQKLAVIDPFNLNASDKIDFLSALERQDGWLFALKQRAITAVAGKHATNCILTRRKSQFS